MAGKQVTRSLPPLAKACATFKSFTKGENQSERVLDLLTIVIQRNRRATPQPFYAMREVAAFFKIALTAVARIYRRLEREGLLTLVRSSQSMMAARLPRPRLAVRGVVCMPLYLPGFINFPDWRIWFSELEEELSRHRFVLEPVFFQQNEETDPAFVDRVLKFNPDYVIWTTPVEPDRMCMESIIDAGVPMVSILGVKTPILPGRIYRGSQERALRRGLEAWKAGGQIDQIVIPCIVGGHIEVMENFGAALQTSPLPYQFKPYDPGGPIPEYLASLAPDRRTGIFFGDRMFFIRLCAMAAEEMFRLFRRHRVIFVSPVMMQSWTMPTDISVDWLTNPSRRMARRIAEDLSQSKGALPSTEEVFEAEWRPHTPLVNLARFCLNE